MLVTLALNPLSAAEHGGEQELEMSATAVDLKAKACAEKLESENFTPLYWRDATVPKGAMRIVSFKSGVMSQLDLASTSKYFDKNRKDPFVLNMKFPVREGWGDVVKIDFNKEFGIEITPKTIQETEIATEFSSYETVTKEMLTRHSAMVDLIKDMYERRIKPNDQLKPEFQKKVDERLAKFFEACGEIFDLPASKPNK